MDSMYDAILTEIELQKSFLGGESIETIYFGGGTPSILPDSQVAGILEQIHKYHDVQADAEITLEGNPDDLTISKLKALRDIGINRLSIGIQSFHNKDLQWMNRCHNATEARECITNAQDCGITDLSADFIFGSNTTTTQMWEQNLTTAAKLDIPHLSCYSLTVESGTALQHRITKGITSRLSESLQAEQFLMTMAFLESQGYEHYEISNYAKEKKYARHNTNYWKQKSYLGIGPAAHSYHGQSRYWNVSHNQKYIDAIGQENIPNDSESLANLDAFNEQIMTGLRTMWGCDKNTLQTLMPDWESKLAAELSALSENGSIIADEKSLRLSPQGKLVADHVMSQLFLTNESTPEKE